MKKHIKLFDDYLVKTGGRMTTQKKDIWEEVYKTRTHFEVEEFIDKIRAKNIKYGRATVYRTIKQLLDAGLIQKIQTRDGKVFYERTPDHQQHDHIICNDTGKIIEIKDERIEKLLNEICDEMGFVPEYRSLHIYASSKKHHYKQ